MPKDLKDHAIAFSGGFILPAAHIVDRVTGNKMGLKAKATDYMYAAKPTIAVDLTGIAGMFLGATTTAAASALALTVAGTSLFTKLANVDSATQNQQTQVTGNADAGTQKVQEAASAAGLIVPKLEAK